MERDKFRRIKIGKENMSYAIPSLKEKIREIITKLEERQERLVPSQSAHTAYGDVIAMLKEALIEKKKENCIINFKPRGRPKGSRNRKLIYEH